MVGIEKMCFRHVSILDSVSSLRKVDSSFFQWVSQGWRENKYVPLIKCRCLPSTFWWGSVYFRLECDSCVSLWFACLVSVVYKIILHW